MNNINNFVTFLKNKHYYSLFRRNFSSPKAYHIHRKTFINELYGINHCSNSSLLNLAFIWGKSNEGYDFWNNIYEEMVENEI